LIGSAKFLSRERNAKIFMFFITVIGWTITVFHTIQIKPPEHFIIFCLLILFLIISEYFPIPVWRGLTTINFPILYILYLVYGLPLTLFTYAVIIFFINLYRHRPMRIILFNPAQMILSLFLSEVVSNFVVILLLDETAYSSNALGIIHFIAFLLTYYVINNFIVDILLILRPQTYSFEAWKQKTYTELAGASISFIYGLIIYLWGSKYQEEIDVFSYFFFFSPLIGISLLTAMVANLKRERTRLNALFEITTELNQLLPHKDWLSQLRQKMIDYIDVDATIIWEKENGEWKQIFQDGRVMLDHSLPREKLAMFEQMKRPIIYDGSNKGRGVAEESFDTSLKTIAYFPMIIEQECIGMLVVGRSRTKSFWEENVQYIATLANQLAIVLKTRKLLKEQEKQGIIEERNRIARDIHDGIAQTLAGAIMKLETTKTIHKTKPEETNRQLTEVIRKLRTSLQEVRESIYGLRPVPTEKMGLVQAIQHKILEFKKEVSIDMAFELRGNEYPLEPIIEKTLYDTFKESVRNCIKHSQATTIHTLIRFQPNQVLLKVKDDGIGFSLYQAMLKARNGEHFGILQMNESAEKLHAILQIDSKEGEGTEITLIVPTMQLKGEVAVD